MQVIAYEKNKTIKKLGSRGAAPPGTNSKPLLPTVFPLTKFNSEKFPIAMRQIEYPNRNKFPTKLQAFDVIKSENVS